MSQLTDGAIVSVSGGVDSTTVLAEAVHRYGRKNVYAVSFFYGQKHSVELEAALAVANYYRVQHEYINLPNIFAGAGSTLVDQDTNVEVMDSYENLAKKHGAQPTVVPNRNMNFIAMCLTYALTKGVNRVMLGVHATDSGANHYPDCSAEFIGAMQAAAEIGNSGQVKLEAPLVHITKGEVVLRAVELKVPLHLTYSCYKGEALACGKCATCHERLDAFAFAGFADPAEYAVYPRTGGFMGKIWPTGSNNQLGLL